MKRRQFLFSSLVATAGSLLAPRVSLAQALPPGRKVIIIGAGLAGLASAYELRKLNYDVTIIEAQSSPGGRVHTFRNFEEPGLYAEAGAARIPRNHDLTLKYVREFSLPLEPFYPTEGKFIRVRGARTEQVGWEKFADSSLFVDLDEPDVWQKVRGGNDQLPRAFAQKLGKAIVYDAPVMQIEQESTRVTVKFKEKGTIRSMSSDILICAIPFTMLAKIEITPSFGVPRTEAIRSLEYDSASRVFIETKKRFWRDQQLNGYAFGEDAAEIWESTFGQPGTHGILQSYLRGGYSLDLMKMAESDRVGVTLGKLERIFPDLRPSFVKGISKCWSEDPWVLGAWAHPGGDTLKIAGTREGRIFFAGEHLSNHASWMQGALESAQRVVKEVASMPVTIGSS